MKGLTATQALQRLLELRGLAPPPEVLHGVGDAPDDPAALQRRLAACGILARVTTVAGADMQLLEAPSLLQLRDGTWLLVRACGRRAFLMEAANGEARLTASALAEQASGVVLDTSAGVVFGREFWRALVALASRYPRAILEAAGASVLLHAAGLVPPLITRTALDRALPDGAGSLLAFLALGVLSIRAIQALVSWLRLRMLLHLQTRMHVALERGFLDHVLHLPFPALQQHTVGDFLQALNGVGVARELVTQRALGASLDGLAALVYLVAMVAVMPGPGALVALGAVGMAGVALVAGRFQARAQGEEVEAQARQRSLLIEVLTGIATVKGAGAEMVAFRRWMERLLAQLAASVRRQRAGIWADTLLDGVRQWLQALLLVWGGYLALSGEVTVGSLIAFLQLSTLFLSSSLALATTAIGFMNLWPQVAAANVLSALAPEPRGAAVRTTHEGGPIVMQDVWFRYLRDAPWTLQAYDLRVEPGEKRWIRGPSGSGKTTMLRLVAGLHAPERGSVSINGRPPLAARGALVYLPQFVYFYGGSLLENLDILSGHAARERLLEAAEASGLAPFVATLPMGWETVLPPGAGSLSAGQRQLVALTAAMAADCKIMLLDEAFSNLDWLSRSWIGASLWFADKTIIYVSHDAGLGATVAPRGAT